MSDSDLNLKVERRGVGKLRSEIVGHVGSGRENDAVGPKGAQHAQPLQVGAFVLPIPWQRRFLRF